MKNYIFKSCSALIISALFISLVYASNHFEFQAKPKQYIIRITSQNSSYPIRFTGSYYASSSMGSKIARIDKVTPFEVEEKANNLSFMFSALNDTAGFFKVVIWRKIRKGNTLDYLAQQMQVMA